MSLRKITVHLVGERSDAVALKSVAAVAKRFGSHIDALFIGSDTQAASDGDAILMPRCAGVAALAERRSTD